MQTGTSFLMAYQVRWAGVRCGAHRAQLEGLGVEPVGVELEGVHSA